MKNGKCIIICPLYQGECLQELQPGPDDLLLCADGGYEAAVCFGLKPQLAIGDFDTMPVEYVKDTPVRKLSPHKDDTDLGMCLQEGRKQGYHTFLLAGCLGGRVDHTLSCLSLMADGAVHGEHLMAIDAVNRVTMLAPGSYVLPQNEGRLLSLLAFSDSVTDICLSGTEWPLEHAELTNRYPLGISNVITADAAKLSFGGGILMVCSVVNRTCL